MNAWRARVIPTLWPRPPRRQHGTAAVEIRCGDSALSAQYSGSVASPAGCKRACVRVRACVRACVRVHGASGVDAEPQCRRWQAGNPSRLVTAVASLRNPPRSRPVARRPFLLRLHRPKFKQRQVAFVTGTVRVVVRTRVGVLVHGQPTGAHLILRVLFVVLRNVVVRGGDPTRPSLPTHDGQISVEVSDREKLRHTEAALGQARRKTKHGPLRPVPRGQPPSRSAPRLRRGRGC